MTTPGRRARGRSVLAAAAVATVGLLLAPRPAGWLGVWHGEILDLGHVPLFAALVVVVRAGAGVALGWAVVVAVALAGLAEVVQPWAGRSGDWADFRRGVLGALVGAAAVRAWESRDARTRAAYLIAVAGLVAWPVAETVPYLADTVAGRRAFPDLADFSTDLGLRRWVCDQATLTRADGSARVMLLPGPGAYSSAALRPVVPDFRGYRWLCWEFEVVGGPLELVFSVRTSKTGGGTTHAQAEAVCAGGRHVVRLDLPAMVGRAAPLDLGDVRYVQLFVVKAREARAVVVSRVRLEP